MKWSMDTHKYISETTRTALKIMASHGVSSESSSEEIDEVEHEMVSNGVYKDYDSAQGRVRRALFTYFKAYHCLDDNEQLTEIGKLYAEEKLSVQEFSFYYIVNYIYKDGAHTYYPTQLILLCLKELASRVSEAAYITPYDFSKLVECNSIEDINREFIDGLLLVRNGQIPPVNERSIGFDVWSKMLVQAGILKRNVDRSLFISNQELVDWILAAYDKPLTSHLGKINSGILKYLPVIPSSGIKGNIQPFLTEGKALQASLFDSVDKCIIDKFIMNSMDNSFADMEDSLGIKDTKGFYRAFVGLEHLIGYSLISNQDHSIKTIGEILSQVEICSEEPIEAEVFTPDWFRGQAESLTTIDQEADVLYKEFRKRFAPEVLKTLSGIDVLHRIFINETGTKDSLCHCLEYDKRYNLFGSVAGRSAFKFGLFYSSKEQSWLTGSGIKKIRLSETEAIELGTKIRDQLVAGAEIIENYGPLNTIQDYAGLQARLYSVMPNTMGKAWVMMYYHMIFPELFPVFYSEEWQKKVLSKINIDADENSFIRMGQIALFVKKCGISNVAFSKIIHKIDALPYQSEDVDEQDPVAVKYTFDCVSKGGHNLVVYGTPGCGKSFYVENSLLKKHNVAKEDRIRTTFYQDYSNTDFIGQILPKVKADKSVTYEFKPGPFTLALKKAIENQDKPVALIIEELNRGNAASIFGDIFQLLDRNVNGCSIYSIVNTNIQDYLNQCFEGKYFFESIMIPANLYIVATMNTSDQNVFTLDTAFKRRWQFEKLRNVFTVEHHYKHYFIPGMPDISWEQLVTDINDFIVNRPSGISSEDKQLGIFFIDKDILCEKQEECGDEIKINKFAYKLFEYLWDDVAKFGHEDWFVSDIKTLDDLIEEYKIKGRKVFVEGVLRNGSNQ